VSNEATTGTSDQASNVLRDHCQLEEQAAVGSQTGQGPKCEGLGAAYADDRVTWTLSTINFLGF